MKVTKPMIIAALIAGSLFACNLALRAAGTNMPPATPPAGAPPPGQRPPGMRGGPTVDQIAEQLKLTDDQKAKVKPILDGETQKMRDLRSDTSLTPNDRRTKMRSIRDETSTQMKAVLTPEQFDQWQKIGPRGRRPGNPPPSGPKPGGTNASAAPPTN